jgi:hypothetical protein
LQRRPPKSFPCPWWPSRKDEHRLRTRTKVLRIATIATVVAGTLLAPTAAWAGHAGGASPDSACGPEVYIDVVTNYGLTYHVVYGPIVDDNGTSSNATDQFSNTWSGTVSTTVSASLEASVSDVVSSVKATVNASATSSVSITVGHTITYTISPHTALHVEYTGKQQHVLMERYQLSATCATKINRTTGDSYVDVGQGWHTWTTAYSG